MEQPGLWMARVIRAGRIMERELWIRDYGRHSRGTISAERRLGKAGTGWSRAKEQL